MPNRGDIKKSYQIALYRGFKTRWSIFVFYLLPLLLEPSLFL